MKTQQLVILTILLSACQYKPNSHSDLPNKADKWVDNVFVQDDSLASHVGKTSSILGATEVKTLNLKSIAVGDDVDGVHVGAIKCSYFRHNAYYGKQYMWRGRWGCQAGRNRDEVSSAVQDNGTKLFDYIYIAPINLR